jgi:uncharacterized protein YidB (DUF937 family)
MLGGNSASAGGLGNLLGGLLSGANHQEAASTVSSVINAHGGIGGLLEKAKSVGLGDAVNSWIGKGENQSINADQVTQLLGNETVQGIASKFGLNLQQAGPLLASMLPVIIDKLTPHGEVHPDQHSGAGLETAVSGLLQGGGLASILGGLMGGK